MCWSESATVAMIGLGAASTAITLWRGEAPAIPAALAFFTGMEALQLGGYWSLGACGTPLNRSVTVLSYVHIALQPIFINAFAMAVAPIVVSDRLRRWVFALSALASALILARLAPFGWAGRCAPGDILCGPAFCTVPGTWHIGWEIPLNDMWGRLTPALSDILPFPAYELAVFGLPLVYGAWRFVVLHAVFGPILASLLTDNPNEMPAVWCLFSIGLLLLGLSPLVRRHLLGGEPRAAV